MTIQSFRQFQLKDFIETGRIPKNCPWQSVAKIALRKLDMLNYAKDLRDLAAFPGNKLEALKGDLVGLYSIRVNDQWRIVFKWSGKGPAEVEIIDYHF